MDGEEEGLRHVEDHAEGIVTVDDASAPPRLVHGGRVLERFMDHIYVPGATENLTPAQIRVVNALRRELVESGDVDPANHEVKRAFASIVGDLGADSVLDWGCGYHPLKPYLPERVTRFVGVDLDPDVVAARRAAGDETYTCDHVAEVALAPFDVGFSVFVWHFDLPFGHLLSIKRLLRSEGLFVANVYRRDSASRAALANRLAHAGLDLRRVADRRGLCRDHEYWLVQHPGAPLHARVDDALS